MNVAVPFRLISDTDLSALRDAFRTEANGWATTWFATAPKVDFHSSDSFNRDRLASEKWMILGGDADTWVAWQLTGYPWQDYARLLLTTPVGSNASLTPLVKSLLHDCLLDLAQRLLSAAGLSNIPTSSAEASLETVRTDYGSGATLGYLCGDLPRQGIAIGGAVVGGLLGRRPQSANEETLVAREAAISNGKTQLEVILGQAEMTLAELANISPGDVIRLQSSFRKPLAVRTMDGQPLVRARLGTCGGHKAIQITERTS